MLKIAGICTVLLAVYIAGFWVYTGIAFDILHTQRFIFNSSVIVLFVVLQIIYLVKTFPNINLPSLSSSKILDHRTFVRVDGIVQNSLFLKITGVFLILFCLGLILLFTGILYDVIKEIRDASYSEVIEAHASNLAFNTFFPHTISILILSLPALYYNFRMLNSKRERTLND